MSIFFVTGTDTGVGKTYTSLLLMRFLFEQGYNPFYLKPIQTGCLSSNDHNTDAYFIYKNTPKLQNKNPSDSVIYCFKAPKAPYFAAQNENAEIDTNRIETIIVEKSKQHTHVVVEGAGGLFVPITKQFMMIDLILKLKALPILVARAGLGTINHTLLSVRVLNDKNIVPNVVFVDASETPTDPLMLEENIGFIESTSKINVLGVIERIPNVETLDGVFYKIFFEKLT